MARRNGEAGSPRVPLRLNTLENTRRSMARVLRYRNEGFITDEDYRALVWGLSQLLGYWRLERELEIERRLEEIETAIGASA